METEHNIYEVSDDDTAADDDQEKDGDQIF